MPLLAQTHSLRPLPASSPKKRPLSMAELLALPVPPAESFVACHSCAPEDHHARPIQRFGSLARIRARLREALTQGQWLCASDASLLGDGRAAIAWAAFDPQGQLRSQGEQRLRIPRRGDSVGAEALALARGARELDALGATCAICLSDCDPAIEWLLRPSLPQAAPFPAREAWDQSARGRFSLLWAPRALLAPANDQARAALGLPREGEPGEGWEPWISRILQS